MLQIIGVILMLTHFHPTPPHPTPPHPHTIEYKMQVFQNMYKILISFQS